MCDWKLIGMQLEKQRCGEGIDQLYVTTYRELKQQAPSCNTVYIKIAKCLDYILVSNCHKHIKATCSFWAEPPVLHLSLWAGDSQPEDLAFGVGRSDHLNICAAGKIYF